jgi:CubicO group peptidase (beta-lactamase class C family)
MKKEGIPALAACVLYKGKVMYQRGFGYVDEAKTKPVSVTTPFPIASLSKPMVAMAVLKLVEQRKLQLEAPIGTLLPDLPEAWRPIPLRRLLDHTSGIPSHTDTELAQKSYTKPVTTEQKYEAMKAVPLRFTPGARYEYSNGNYFLAGLIIDKVVGESHEKFMKDFMFRPLGMRDTEPLTEELMKRTPGPYRGEKPAVPIHPSWLYGNGAMVTTIVDLAKWDSALYTERMLRANTLAYITTDQKLTDGKPVGYAMGWMLGSVRGKRSILHTGLLWGYRSYFSRFADYDLTVILVSNQQAVDLEPMARNLASMVVPELGVRMLTPIRDDYPELTAKHRKFFEDCAAGTFTREGLSAAIDKDMDATKTANFLRPLIANGRITDFRVVERSQPANNEYRSRYGMWQGKQEWLVTLVQNSEGTIVGLFCEVP